MIRARCSTCGAEIVWCRTERGKAMPVDADPVPDGNIEIDLLDSGPRARVLPAEPLLVCIEVRHEPRYVSHFVTCPQAAQHRRAR